MANDGGGPGAAAPEQLPGMGGVPAADVRPGAAASAPGGARAGSTGRATGKAGKKASRKGARTPSATRKVARVVVDVPLSHLDRPFDYLVPTDLDEPAVPGCRVRVRFAGQLVDGFLLERVDESEHEGRLSFLERVISAEPVLTREVAALAREVADRYAGTLCDVLRLAIPPRHARVEAEAGQAARPSPDIVAGVGAPAEPGPWQAYPAGASFLAALAEGRSPRAVWNAMPGPDWPAAVALAVRATLAAGRGALVVVAAGRDVARVDAALRAELSAATGTAAGAGVAAAVTGRDGTAASPPGEPAAVTTAGPEAPPALHVALTAELGPAERYRRWLAVLRGDVRAVVGTRAAMFAPVRDLGLVVLWDDGDDVHAEPHAPYPHAREVLALRAHRAGAGALIGGFTRTTDATQLIETGWAHALAPDRATLRQVMPRIRPAGEDAELARDEAARSARLPHLAFRTARQALVDGPVLVQVPRRGYVPALACGRCRAPARCEACQGTLSVNSSHAAPYCRWCGRIAGRWQCPECGGGQVRATMVGARRTAEELGRAFPGVSVRTSGRDGVLDRVGGEAALVVATPGAEPVADDGYAAALLLDGWVLLGRADLRAGEEALRRWMNAAALVRPAAPVVLLADSALGPVQALLRWDPVTHAERELGERRELGFPPAARMASLTGTPAALRELLEAALLPEGAQVLGPVPVPAGTPAPAAGGGGTAGARAPGSRRPAEDRERALVRVERAGGHALAHALKAGQGVRSARKAADPVRVQIDPLELI
ncbi:primosomal protein N' [Actinomadura alba]|uniref:primosomal protein N' n=1 Tax=Actinomadura alba TaxID=406431 RepID=UPI003CD06307